MDLGVQPGILVPEALGLGNWVKAQEWAAVPGGQATYLGNPVPWGSLPTILVIEFVAIAFAEHQRTMEKDPEKKKYPGGAFDPLGFSKDPVKFEEYKLKEIKNGQSLMPRLISYLLWPSAASPRPFSYLNRLGCRPAGDVGVRRVLRAAVGVPGHRATGEPGHSPRRPVAQQHR